MTDESPPPPALKKICLRNWLVYIHLFYIVKFLQLGIIILAVSFRGFLTRIKHRWEIERPFPKTGVLRFIHKRRHYSSELGTYMLQDLCHCRRKLWRIIMKCSGLVTVFSTKVCAGASPEQSHLFVDINNFWLRMFLLMIAHGRYTLQKVEICNLNNKLWIG